MVLLQDEHVLIKRYYPDHCPFTLLCSQKKNKKICGPRIVFWKFLMQFNSVATRWHWKNVEIVQPRLHGAA